jgi:hypothetical protein
MKNFIALVIVLVVALLAYSYFAKGGLPFMPSEPQSGEAQQVAQLADDFRSACNEYRQAGRTAGLTGLDSTSEADAALGEIDRIEKALTRLKADITTDDARRAADKLAAEISAFKRGLR